MCDQEFPHPLILSSDPITGPVQSVALEEISEHVNKMNGKLTGPDNIQLKSGKVCTSGI